MKKEGLLPKITVGAYVERKDREFAARWMSLRIASTSQFDNSQLYLPLDEVFSAEHINPTTGFKLEEGTNPSDAYTGANTLLAGYLAGQIGMENKWNVKAGARVEHNRQELNSGTHGGQPVGVDKRLLFVLPSVNASLNITERSVLRAGWGTTLNRPEFRELAPFAYYDFSTNTVIYGNPKLRTASVQNADARFEFYPSLNEVVSLGAFYKRFSDPIEMYYVPGTGGGGTRNFTFYNAVSAHSMGLEAEVRLSTASWAPEGFLARWGVLFNGAWIHSAVDLGATQGGQASERPMMGQSPWVLNAGLYYADPEHKLQSATLRGWIHRHTGHPRDAAQRAGHHGEQGPGQALRGEGGRPGRAEPAHAPAAGQQRRRSPGGHGRGGDELPARRIPERGRDVPILNATVRSVRIRAYPWFNQEDPARRRRTGS